MGSKEQFVSKESPAGFHHLQEVFYAILKKVEENQHQSNLFLKILQHLLRIDQTKQNENSTLIWETAEVLVNQATKLIESKRDAERLVQTKANNGDFTALAEEIDYSSKSGYLLQFPRPFPRHRRKSTDNGDISAINENETQDSGFENRLSVNHSHTSVSPSECKSTEVFPFSSPSNPSSSLEYFIPSTSSSLSVPVPKTSPSPPPPPPPPPPPLPSASFSLKGKVFIKSPSNLDSLSGDSSSQSSPVIETPKPKSKMKSINWSKIPAYKVLTSRKPNIWNLVAKTHQQNSSDLPRSFDFETLEDLFCQTSPSSAPNSCPGSPQISRKTAVSDPSTPFNSLERRMMTKQVISNNVGTMNGNTNVNSNCNNLGNNECVILDGRKSLNINILLKQFKGSSEDFLSKIKQLDHKRLGVERLKCLLRILPEESETDLLEMQRHNFDRMPLAERFLLRLMEIPSYKLRIEYMLLREEFTATVAMLFSVVESVLKASKETQESINLREVFYIILVAGNFLNSGGYAGDAAGFKLMSLLKLADIRGNKPGISFIHYVAELARKRNVNNFAADLPHLEKASKFSMEALNSEVGSISQKVSKMKIDSQVCNSDKAEFFVEMKDFLCMADKEVSELKKLVKEDLEIARMEVADFFCEDSNVFKLDECFRILQSFVQRFKLALDENKKREELEAKSEARRITRANEGNNAQINVNLETCTKNGRSVKLTKDDLDSGLVEFLRTVNQIAGNGPDGTGTFRRNGSGRRPRASSANSFGEGVDASRERTSACTWNDTDGRRRSADGKFVSVEETIKEHVCNTPEPVSKVSEDCERFCNREQHMPKTELKAGKDVSAFPQVSHNGKDTSVSSNCQPKSDENNNDTKPIEEQESLRKISTPACDTLSPFAVIQSTKPEEEVRNSTETVTKENLSYQKSNTLGRRITPAATALVMPLQLLEKQVVPKVKKSQVPIRSNNLTPKPIKRDIILRSLPSPPGNYHTVSRIPLRKQATPTNNSKNTSLAPVDRTRRETSAGVASKKTKILDFHSNVSSRRPIKGFMRQTLSSKAQSVVKPFDLA